MLIYLEVQSQPDRFFAERMFRYHARLFDHYRRQVVSLAILGDDRASWRPADFGYAGWGCALHLTFPTSKLLDYDTDALETNQKRIVQLFRFIEWLLRLPPELEDRTWREIRAFEEAEQMTYITYGERIGLERGRSEGLQEAIAFGIELKFDDAGTDLLPEIRQIADLTILHGIMARLKTAATLDDVRAVYLAGE